MEMNFELMQQLQHLYARYTQVVDAGLWKEWPELFTEICSYRVQPRENFDRGFPLATLSFESKGMLKDRAYAISETLFHDPYYQRHVVAAPLVLRIENNVIHAQANYAVFRTKLSQETTVFNVGRYLDEIVQTPQGLLFQSRQCIYDTELIPNSMIYPI